MSRLTKYLGDTATVVRMERDPDTHEAALDKYGAAIPATTDNLKCRREKVFKDVTTSTGRIVRSYSRYYFDEAIELFIADKIDDAPILEIEELTSRTGTVEGYLAYV